MGNRDLVVAAKLSSVNENGVSAWLGELDELS
jgi:hypothetical protein